jgi:fructose-1-phosphate kinase PfkB-like protein
MSVDACKAKRASRYLEIPFALLMGSRNMPKTFLEETFPDDLIHLKLTLSPELPNWLDTRDALRHCVANRPYLLKQNEELLEKVFGREFHHKL